jgi:hypothetical protein
MLFGVGVCLVSSSAAWAGNPTDAGQGMGTAQPLASNLSVSPHWRVYRFAKQGVEYLQVNDGAGQVHVGIGTANGIYLVLPMGSDAGHVSTPDAPLTAALSHAETVYRDAHTVLSVGIDAAGQWVWSAAPASASSNAVHSQTGSCDPDSCPINRIQVDSASTCDPNSCPINRGDSIQQSSVQ